MRETQRFIVFDQNNESRAVRIALAQIARLARNHANKATILVPMKDRYSTLEEILGSPAVDGLLAGSGVMLERDVHLALESIRTFNRFQHHVVLALYPGKKMLDLIDDSMAPAIVIVPMMIEEVKDWRRAWNPDVVGETACEAVTLIANPVVAEAMRALTDAVNLRTGLTHPRDKASAVDLLRKLRDAREVYNPADLRAWAVGHGWTPKGADELQDTARAIVAGRVVRTTAPAPWREDILEVLRKRAAWRT